MADQGNGISGQESNVTAEINSTINDTITGHDDTETHQTVRPEEGSGRMGIEEPFGNEVVSSNFTTSIPFPLEIHLLNEETVWNYISGFREQQSEEIVGQEFQHQNMHGPRMMQEEHNEGLLQEELQHEQIASQRENDEALLEEELQHEQIISQREHEKGSIEEDMQHEPITLQEEHEKDSIEEDMQHEPITSQEEYNEDLLEEELQHEQSISKEESNNEIVRNGSQHQTGQNSVQEHYEDHQEQESQQDNVLEQNIVQENHQETTRALEETRADTQIQLYNMTPFPRIMKVFRCFHCHRCIRPPIYQCRMGHLKCSSCSSQSSTRCFLCAKKSDSIRNTALDKIASFLYFPCRNIADGCNVLKKLNNIEEHENKECLYKKINCPYSGIGLCSSWKGTKLQLIPHLLIEHLQNFRREHGSTRVLNGHRVRLLPYIEAINYGSNLPTRTIMWTFIQQFMDNHFLINLFYKYNDILNVHFITVRMIETVRAAKQYRSKVSLEGPNGEQLRFEGVCHSIYEKTEYIYRNRDCLTFDSNTAIRCTKKLPSGHKALLFTCEISDT